MTGQRERENRRILRIGTRKSRLAMAQTELVVRALCLADPQLKTEVVPFVTTGDKILDKSLVEFGGKGVFVSEFEQAILDGTIDIAVHSAKDMPALLMDGLEISAVLPRDDPRDVLVTRKDRVRGNSPFVIGTSSLRRQVQIMERQECVCKLLRGNVNTRLGKLAAGEYDGILLAAAGLKRLGLLEEPELSYEFLSPLEFIPSGGQAVIAVEGRKNSEFGELFYKIDHAPSRLSLAAEREVLKILEAGCNQAVGVYSFVEQGTFFLKLMKETESGICRLDISGRPEDSLDLARELAGKFTGKPAGKLSKELSEKLTDTEVL